MRKLKYPVFINRRKSIYGLIRRDLLQSTACSNLLLILDTTLPTPLNHKYELAS